MAQSLERAKQRLWARVQKDLGFCASPELKEVIDTEAGAVYDLEDLDFYETSVVSFMQIAKLGAMSQYLPPQRKPPNNGTKYQGPFQKRLYLVNFVINHQLALRHRKNKRINWKQTCEAWNTAHPYAPMRPPVLKATYHRAAAGQDIQNALFINQLKETMQGLRDALQRNLLTDNALDSIRKLLRVRPEKMPVLVEERWEVILICMEDFLTGVIEEEVQNDLQRNVDGVNY